MKSWYALRLLRPRRPATFPHLNLNAIIIDPVRCPETAAEFTGYEYLRDARTGEVTNAWPDADNHHIDAVRYALESVWRRRGS